MTKLQIAYVLCTDKPDYFHVLAASATLTRAAIPHCTMVCVMDRKTRKTAAAAKIPLSDWIDEIVVVRTPHRKPLLKSRYLKTTLRSHLTGDFLYLDIDAIVVDPEVATALECGCIAASQNRDHADHAGTFPENIGRSIYEPLGWRWPFLPYVNSGVMLCRDNGPCHDLFRRWHELWNEQVRTTGHHLDQPALNRAISEAPSSLKLMPPAFNQPVDAGPQFENGAWVYHYYLSVYSGVPKAESLLGMASWRLRHKGRISQGFIRWAVAQKQAFPRSSYGTLAAIRQSVGARFPSRRFFQIAVASLRNQLHRQTAPGPTVEPAELQS